MGPVLIDTSVIIGVLRQHENALGLAETVKGRPKAVTDGVIGEVLAGARDKREFIALLRHMQEADSTHKCNRWVIGLVG